MFQHKSYITVLFFKVEVLVFMQACHVPDMSCIHGDPPAALQSCHRRQALSHPLAQGPSYAGQAGQAVWPRLGHHGAMSHARRRVKMNPVGR